MRQYIKDAYYGLLHALVAFTSIVVVSQITGFSMVNTFLFAGIGTLVFHLITKNKVASVMGISGSYIGGMAYVAQTYGKAYVLGGVIITGIMYILFGLLMFKHQKSVLKYLPDWLLSASVMLIGLMLIPIGKMMVQTNYLIGIIALGITVIISSRKSKLSMFAVPIALLITTLISFLLYGIDLSVLNTPLTAEFMMPKFTLESLTAIGIISIPVLGELLGDVKNTGWCMNKNLFEEVGVGRIAIGNGISSIISGVGGSLPNTSYSENAGFLLMSKYTRPHAQLFTAVFFMIFAAATPLLKVVMLIPKEAFGGVALYLYCLIVINAIKNLSNEKWSDKKITIISIMLALFFMDYVIGGVAVSSIAVSVIFGVIANIFIKD